MNRRAFLSAVPAVAMVPMVPVAGEPRIVATIQGAESVAEYIAMLEAVQRIAEERLLESQRRAAAECNATLAEIRDALAGMAKDA